MPLRSGTVDCARLLARLLVVNQSMYACSRLTQSHFDEPDPYSTNTAERRHNGDVIMLQFGAKICIIDATVANTVAQNVSCNACVDQSAVGHIVIFRFPTTAQGIFVHALLT